MIPDFGIGMSESVGTTILCNPSEAIREEWLCSASCGPSPMLNSFTVTASSLTQQSTNTTIQLPPLTGRTYHCVVNATTDDDTVTVLRGRLSFNVSGMYMYMSDTVYALLS